MIAALKRLYQGNPTGLAPPTFTSVGPSGTSGTLTPGVTYGIRVSSVSSAGESHLSPELVCNTGVYTAIGVTINNVEQNATSYNVYQGPVGGPWLLFAGATPSPANTATITVIVTAPATGAVPPAGNTSIKSGGIAVSPSAPLYTPPALTATVNSKALSSRIATLGTIAPHGFLSGDALTVSGMGAPFDGHWTILSTPSTTTLTYAVVAANVASAAASGIAIAGPNAFVREVVFANPNGPMINSSNSVLRTFSGIAIVWLSLVPYGQQIDGSHFLIPGMTVQPTASATGPLLGTWGMKTLHPGDFLVAWANITGVACTIDGIEGTP